MHIKKIVLLITLVLPGAVSGQIRSGNYQAFKIGKEETIEMISVNVVPLGNEVMHFHEGNPRKPLTGRYRITVNRTESYTGTFKKGIVDGNWERFRNDNLVHKSFYVNGLIDGESINYRQNGEVEYVTTYKNGLRKHFISYHQDGSRNEERLYDENGRLHGEMLTYGPDGNITEEKRYRNGFREGKQVKMGSDGYITSQEYVNNKKNGPYIKSYPDGSPLEKGTFDENEGMTGKWITWKENGDLSTEAYYLNDKLHGEKRVYYSGEKLKRSEEYQEGKLHGTKIEYDEDPHRVSREVTYAEGRMHGPFRVYHEGILWREGAYQDGSLIYEKEFANGKLQIVKLLDESGTLVNVERYDNTGKRTYKNTGYKKHSSVILKESASGVLDVEIK